jgi:hypothetical protein
VPEDEVRRAASLLGVTLDAEEASEGSRHRGDARIETAYGLALIGLALCPGLAHVVSLALILMTRTNTLSVKGGSRMRQALAVDLMVLIGAVIVVKMLDNATASHAMPCPLPLPPPITNTRQAGTG